MSEKRFPFTSVLAPVPGCLLLCHTFGFLLPEAKELTELQPLKLQDALSPFVFLSPVMKCAAEVHAHISVRSHLMLKGRFLHSRFHKSVRKCEGRVRCFIRSRHEIMSSCSDYV